MRIFLVRCQLALQYPDASLPRRRTQFSVPNGTNFDGGVSGERFRLSAPLQNVRGATRQFKPLRPGAATINAKLEPEPRKPSRTGARIFLFHLEQKSTAGFAASFWESAKRSALRPLYPDVRSG